MPYGVWDRPERKINCVDCNKEVTAFSDRKKRCTDCQKLHMRTMQRDWRIANPTYMNNRVRVQEYKKRPPRKIFCQFASCTRVDYQRGGGRPRRFCSLHN